MIQFGGPLTVLCSFLGSRLGYFEIAGKLARSVICPIFIHLRNTLDRTWRVWQTEHVLLDLHNIYGAIVRIRLKDLVFSYPNAIKQIYPRVSMLQKGVDSQLTYNSRPNSIMGSQPNDRIFSEPKMKS